MEGLSGRILDERENNPELIGGESAPCTRLLRFSLVVESKPDSYSFRFLPSPLEPLQGSARPSAQSHSCTWQIRQLFLPNNCVPGHSQFATAIRGLPDAP